jgi:hypothetical protein
VRVLITNVSLEVRGGTESFVRALARGLQRKGHSVIAFSSDPTQQERLLESDVVPVATDLERLPFRPDIIHAQHHLDVMTTLASLPGVPALYLCHGAVWREAVPKHPRIYRYGAVSRTLAQRITIESNIAAEDVAVLLNAVDLEEFPTVRRPPARPRRALFYNGRHTPDSPTVSAIREATARVGLELEFIGATFDRMALFPQHVLPDYDLVFASGRSAIEALACGCAVVVLGRTSCGELVRSENFDRYRQVNFTIAVNSPPPSADAITSELQRYSADDCAAVSARIRREADFRTLIDTLVDHYEQIIERHRTTPPDASGEMQAMARYLRRIVPLIRMTDLALEGKWSSPARAESFEELRAELALLQKRVECWASSR